MNVKELEKTLATGFSVIPINKLERSTWNYKLDDPNKTKILRNSIEKNKEALILVVRETKGGKYEVVDGNHRLDVLNEMGWKGAICRNLGKVSDVVARRMAVSLNELKFAYDPAKLGTVINDLIESGETIDDLAQYLAFNSVELQTFVSLTTDDFKFSAEEDDVDTPDTESEPGQESYEAVDSTGTQNALTFYLGKQSYPVVVTALDHAIEKQKLNSRADALVALSKDYLKRNKVPIPEPEDVEEPEVMDTAAESDSDIKHKGKPRSKRGRAGN